MHYLSLLYTLITLHIYLAPSIIFLVPGRRRKAKLYARGRTHNTIQPAPVPKSGEIYSLVRSPNAFFSSVKSQFRIFGKFCDLNFRQLSILSERNIIL